MKRPPAIGVLSSSTSYLGASILPLRTNQLIKAILPLLFFVLFCSFQASAAPRITAMTPQEGPVGTVVVITGSGFGTTQGSSTVTFNGTPVTWVSWGSSTLQVQVPAGATSGNVVVKVSGASSNTKTFAVTQPPVISSLSQTSGALGSSFTITGSGFTAGGTQTPQVVFNPQLYASPTTSSDTSITVTVPAGATTGDVLVSVGGGDSNGVLFTVTSSDPSISSISPSGGTVGTSVTIAGSSFGSSKGSSTVTFNGTSASPTSWSATSIVVPVPSGATTGNVIVTVAGVASNSYGFEVGTAAPSITSMSVTSGAVGTATTITGKNFGASQGSSTVNFNGASGIPTSWNATTIKVPVPSGATTGNVVVNVGLTPSNGVAFTVPGTGPNISGLSQTSGPVGSSVTITGTNFGQIQGSSMVSFGGVAATATGWSPTSIVAIVPSGAATGNVVVAANGASSNGVSFTVSPYIVSLSPTSGIVGSSVTITGTSFGSSQGTVTFNGTTASPTSWSAGSIVVPVPAGATTGNVVVTASGVASNGVGFTVAPNITGISPNPAAIGTSVTISGSGFGPSAGTVTFNGTTATPTSWSSGSIAVPVPTGATTGNVVVTASGIASNGISFTVQALSFAPTSGQMAAARYGHTATQLANGKLLIAGGINSSGVLNEAEVYTLSSQTFATAANPMSVPRWLHTATLLNDGTVLIAGGSSVSGETTLNSAEVYDPVAGTFALLPNTLNTARVGHTATLLSNGQVLIVGGYDPNTGIISDAELYDPVSQVFIDLGNTNRPRFHYTATLLQNGQVLIAGGETDPTPSGAYNTGEIFNPQTWTFSVVSVNMIAAREGHTATLLNDGTVLITGGDNPPNGSLSSAEIFNPTSTTFTSITAAMTKARVFHDAALLNGGQVLISGGENDSNGTNSALNTAELYNPTNQTFTATPGNMMSVREHQTATLLNDGTVLEDGGTDGTNTFNTAEIYTTSQLMGLATIAISPVSPSVPLGSQQLLVATGTFSGGGTQVLSSVLWSSSSTAVGTVSGDSGDSGYVTTIAQGTATITATTAGVSGSTTVTVPAPALVSITLSPLTLAMPLGTTQQFDAVGTYSDGSTQDLTSTATWTSSSSSATVNTVGLVTAAALGTSTIQATLGSQSSSTTVTVGSPALVSLAVTPPTAVLAAGQSQQYQAIGTYTDSSTQNLTSSVSWYAIPQTSASVNSVGFVTATAQGNVNITASYGTFSGVSALTVGTRSLVSISVPPGMATVPVGSDQQFIAVATYSDGSSQDITSSATWTSSNNTASSITATGLATALASGTATITASSGASSGSATFAVSGGTLALNTSRYQQNATLLNNGSVLFAGGVTCPAAGSCAYLNSAEVYSPGSGTITNTGSMAAARSAPAVLLGNGKVLVAGGYSCDSNGNCTSLSSAEIYDPLAGTFSSAGNMTTNRYGHTMTLLNSGQVLIAGGESCTSATSCTALNSAELYNPVAGTFTATGSLNNARFNASAVALSSGKVLVAGGFDGTNFPAAAELFNPTVGTFTATGSLNTPRANATATLLNNGQVMIAGGSTCGAPGCPTPITEMFYSSYFYYPTYPSGNMTVPRFDETATILTDGQIFFAGGYDACSTACTSDSTAELFDPTAFTFTSTQSLSMGRSGHTATLLADGSVLIAGGINNGTTLSSTDSYEPSVLALPGLASIAISPSNPPIAAGSTLSLTATGYTSYGALYGYGAPSLQSVIWSSSSPSVTTVSNAPGSAGIVNALTSGTTTITATNGSIIASTEVTVTAPLVSITISPTNPTVSVGSNQPLQLTATGNFSDGSTANLTANATWTSTSNSVAMLSVIPGSPVIVIPVSSGTVNVSAAYAGVSGSTTVTVNVPLAPVPPNITGVSPTSGGAGTQVTITGSGFGATQGSGNVWLGTTLGSVVSWSDGQVVAAVSTGSSPGVVEIQQTNGESNTVAFTVNTAMITGISPNNGLPGTQVTITGSGFGAAQGTGNVWLGTVPAVVNNWSDGQVVATVGVGAASGNAVILQHGVMSNAVPFAINLPQITGISPNSGSAGTVVTITGSGFGATQGSGSVWIGSTYGSVIGWSNTQIVASVASNAVTGVVKVQQNGTWSNATTFSVPTIFGGGGSGGSAAATLAPNVINMLVGSTQSIQALNSSGQPVTGSIWTSSNTAVATLSSSDPPVITAVAAGNATITAADPSGGSISADVTVWSGASLPTGTVIWSNPGDGSGVSSIVPAVPSMTGVADIFAQNADGSVQAITASGQTAWTTPNVSGQLVPDFQGGTIVYTGGAIYRLDGITGQPSTWTYASASGNNLATPLVHTSGIIFTIDGSTVVGINSLTGDTFSVQMENSSSSGSGGCTNFCTSPLPQSQGSSSGSPPLIGNLMIAGDGYAYVPYSYTVSQESGGNSGCGCGCIGSGASTQYLKLLRVGPTGDSYEISLGEFSSASSGYECDYQGSGSAYSASATLPTLITYADQGVLASYAVTYNNAPTSYYLATTSGASLASNSQIAMVLEQTSPVQPVLQQADGSFIGTVSSTVGNFMVAFTGTGSTLFTVPNDTPQIATSNGGVIGASGTNYDKNGNVTGQSAPLTPPQNQSGSGQWPGWLGNVMGSSYAVTSGTASSLASTPTNYAPTFAALVGGNNSGQGTAIQQVQTNQSQGFAKQLPDLTLPIFCRPGGTLTGLDAIPLPITPTCGNINAIELLTSKSPSYIFQNYLQTFAPVADIPNKRPNTVMYFDNPEKAQAAINVTSPGQILKITLEGFPESLVQRPFYIMTERVDTTNNVISVVTLQGHPLAGWRYWRVYSIGTNDLVIETGAYDQPGPGLRNFAGYYIGQREISSGWQQFLQFIQLQLKAPQGSSLNGTLGGIQLKNYEGPSTLLQGYWDYAGDFTTYILKNVCQSSSCN